MKRSFRLTELAQIIGANLHGEDLEIKGINALPLAKEDELTFVDSLRRVDAGKKSRAGALLVPLGLSEYFPEKSVLEVKDVRVALAKISKLFYDPGTFSPGIHPFSVVAKSAKIHPTATIGPFTYIGEGVEIGEKVIVYPFCFIGDFCRIEEETILYPHVVLYPGTIVGKKCILHAGVVLGADGFGYAQEPVDGGYRNLKIFHFGRTRLEDEVEVGANSTIDRATFGETLVGAGTKIDNLVQIGHNVRIGKENILVSHTAIGGSAILEDYVMLAGQVGVAPQSIIRKGARVAAKSGVVGEVPEGTEVAGIPAIKSSVWKRAVVIFEKLPEIYKELKKLLGRS